jgi:uncharacterized protein (TIGR02266 family)
VKPSNSTKESRVAPRVDLEVNVDFESEHNFYTGFTQNISSGGLFIATRAPMRVGSRFPIRFGLPGLSAQLEINVIVRWVRDVENPDERGMGVQFESLSAPAREAINAFIKQRESLFYDDE